MPTDGSTLLERPVLDKALGALSDARRRGLVVVGAPGVGTSTLAHQVLERAAGVALTLRASAASRDVPYAALLPLLHEEPEALQGPAHALGAVARRLHALGAGQAVVLAVHAAQHLDSASSLLLLALTAEDACRLVLLTDEVEHLPPDLRAAALDGVLGVVRVRPLGRAALGRLVEARWGQVLPARSLQTLHRVTRGHLRSVAAVLDMADDAAPGADPAVRLETALDSLVWGARPLPALLSAVPTAVASLSLTERSLLDALALSGGLAVGTLRRAVDQDALDVLLRSGLVRLVEQDDTVVAPMDEVVAAAVRAQAGPTRRSRLLEACYPDGPPAPGTACGAGWTRWAAACRVPVPVRLAASAVVAAVEAGNLVAARATLAAAAPHESPEVLSLLRAVVLAREEGWTAAALEALVQLPALDLADADLCHLVAWSLQQTLDVVPEGGGQSWAEHLFESLTTGDRLRTGATPHGLRACRELHQGRALGAVALLREELVRPADGTADPALVARWRRLLAARLDVAAALSGGATGMTEPDPHHDAGDQYLVPLLLRFLTGEAVAAATVEDGVPQPAPAPWPLLGDLRPATATYHHDLVVGLGLLVRGDVEAARRWLRPVAAAQRPSELLASRLASVALVAADALEGTRPPVAEAEPVMARAPWVVRRCWTLLHLWARGAAGDTGATELLLDEGTADLAAGRHLTALRFLLAALVLGREGAAAPLLGAARQVRGPVAAGALPLATAVRDGDGDALARIALMAEDEGHRILALGVARLAHVHHAVPADVEHARRMRSIRARSVRVPGVGEPARVRGLTPREGEIAALVARGLPNAEVARLLQLSVRTVEGHVSNVFAKLAVSTRGELADVLRTMGTVAEGGTQVALRSIG
ncbi:helix-turn-helix transcriptional regulator [Cellulomonas marina]|uniref:Regulatory protein, luxR family n=1 Tax=Cellulomonas marina TaxID=988821 RepID=A0A1I0X1G3_9CELL|nr:LuxR C-terminal-related transcriptional regulator [Cellulomonas marina]GIG29381.1 hypothetical protein Cma02nite_19810 [Cellulomonas marina]SFA94835.1 regulatory protein, luxR family [Cellulomonas marina]